MERGEEAIGIDPGADALDEHMAVDGHGGIQVGPEDAVVFGTDVAEVHAEAGHAADVVGEEDEVFAEGQGIQGPGDGFGREKAEGGADVAAAVLVPFQDEPGIGRFGAGRIEGDMPVAGGDGLHGLKAALSFQGGV